ncbi:MAG: hypothetical protein ACLSUM_05640 [Dysosmobacter welbionis]
MKSWSQRELALAVLVVFGGDLVPRAFVLCEGWAAHFQRCDAADPVPLRLISALGDRDAVFASGKPAGLA